jgi:hypothetical protein
MSPSERRTYFERLCSLRDGYAASAVDRRGVLSLDDAMLYAEALMTALDEPAWDESGIVEFDGSTSRTHRIRRPDSPFGPRPVGRWASDAGGWRPIR